MWRMWLLIDPRRAIIATALFVVLVVSTNHFIQLSTPRYGSWLNEGAPGASAAVMHENRDVLVAKRQ